MTRSPCAICDKIKEDKMICSKKCEKLESYQDTIPVRVISSNDVDVENIYINKFIFKDVSFSEILRNL